MPQKKERVFMHTLPQFKELLQAMKELPGDISVEGLRSGYRATFERLDQIPLGQVAKEFYGACRAKKQRMAA